MRSPTAIYTSSLSSKYSRSQIRKMTWYCFSFDGLLSLSLKVNFVDKIFLRGQIFKTEFTKTETKILLQLHVLEIS